MHLSSVIRLLLVIIMAHKEQVGKCWIMDYIGLLSLKMHRWYMKIVSSAKGQPDPFQEGMKCLNNPCYIVRYLIFGVLIFWVFFLLLLGFLYFACYRLCLQMGGSHSYED